MKKLLCILSFALITPFVANAQSDEMSGIVEAFEKGDAAELQKYIAGQVDCLILGKKNIYSKAQAVQVMKDYFAQNKVKTFKVLHRGQDAAGGVKYIIGTYTTTADKEHRVTIFVKKSESESLIQKIIIENNNKAS